MTEQFRTNFSARLAIAISAVETSMTLSSVPVSLPAGTYRFRFGSNPQTSEWISAEYPGSGATFSGLVRAAEGSNPARAWVVGTLVSHVLTGLSLTAFTQPTPPPQVTHEEFVPAASATSIGLGHIPGVVLTVARNGLVQSVGAGHYTVSGATLTFSTVFIASERVVVAYSYVADETLLGSGPVGKQSVALPPGRTLRSRDYSFTHVSTTPT